MNLFLVRKWVPFLLLAAATAAVWGHTLGFEFVWDDRYFITELESVRSLANIPAMFHELEAQGTKPLVFQVFRPIRTAHYALLHFLGGKALPQAWIFHLANVLWHGATALLLYFTSLRLFACLRAGWTEERGRVHALIVALGFAVHPTASEVVCWAKGLDDVLATFFALAALRELLKSSDERQANWRALGLFVLAVYSKESAVAFALVPLVICRSIHRLSWNRSLRRTAAFVLIAALYVVHRRLVLGRNSQVAPLSGTYVQTLVDMLQVVPIYLRLSFGIPPFRIDYSYLPSGLSLASACGLTLLAGLGTATVLAWRRTSFRPAAFGLLWTGLFLLPVSNLLPMMQYMAERFLYLPLAGWLIALATLLAVIPRQTPVRALAFAGLLAWALVARQRSQVWRDDYTLYVTHYTRGPKTERLEHNVRAALLQLPGIQRVTVVDEAGLLHVGPAPDAAALAAALADYEHALVVLPDDAPLLSGYATTLGNAGRFEEAVRIYERVVVLRPKPPVHWVNLARALTLTGQPEKARAAAAQAAARAPNDANVLALQAQIEAQLRKKAE
ncbi:MAG: tetratricopeptide repeat protein [Planctomycetes bacterium]|nr:tetratricopeptide repeat protein [Planctomycetota bacterium]